MADALQFVRDLFKQAGVALSQNDVWAVQGTPVVKHHALERLGAAVGIKFDMPVVLRSERDEAVFLVRGTHPNGVSDWSTGEAQVVKDGQLGGNYKVSGKQASYVYAMAEKRARDRVILKLAGLHGVYSEEEADEFKGGAGTPAETAAARYEREAIEAANQYDDLAELEAWYKQEGETRRGMLSNDAIARVKTHVTARVNALKARQAEAA